jgi:hypothetical protein
MDTMNKNKILVKIPSVSLGSSTVQLHCSIDSRRACALLESGLSSQRRPCLKSSVLLCVLFGQHDSMQRILMKQCFLFTVGSVYRLKWFTPGSGNCHLGDRLSLITKRLKRRGEVAETTAKRLLCCGFRYTGKVMGPVCQCW